MSGRAEPVADLREGATFGATVGPDVRSAAYPSRGASPGAAAVGLRGPRAASPRRRRAGTAWAPTEADLQRAIIDAARARGWLVAHFRPAQTATGRWVTPVEADGKGFPDLILAHPAGGFLALELKGPRGVVSPEQARWVDTMRAAGVDARVVRPGDLDAVLDSLAMIRGASVNISQELSDGQRRRATATGNGNGRGARG